MASYKAKVQLNDEVTFVQLVIHAATEEEAIAKIYEQYKPVSNILSLEQKVKAPNRPGTIYKALYTVPPRRPTRNSKRKFYH